MFADEVKIKIKAGDGGNGIVSWDRQKYRPKGGPAGGDGGKGGDIIFISDENLNTLSFFTTNKYLKATKGSDGRTYKKRGSGGDDLVLKVPVGTLLWDDEKGELIADLSSDGDVIIGAYGGDGGYGNAHFVSSVRQAPEIAELGEPGEEKEIRLELKLMADVGLVGLPNVGKSTLLSVITKAKPKIANYPFTTLIPNLGVVERLPDGSLPDSFGFVVADIPGLIEGAAKGKGLGDEFLRHIERTRLLVHIIDATAADFGIDFRTINNELGSFKKEMLKKPMIVAVSKVDLVSLEELNKKLKNFIKKIGKLKINISGSKVFVFSAVTRQGLNDLLFEINKELKISSRQKEEALEDYKEYSIKDRKVGFDIIKEQKDFCISGPKVERFAIRTDFNNVPAMYRFRHILKRMGVENELKKLGVKNGDKIYVKDKSFEFKEF